MKKRLVLFSTAICLVFALALGRIGYIISCGGYTVSSSYNSYSLTIDKIYPTVYDRNLKKLTNKGTSLVAVIRPNEKCLSELKLLFTQDEIEEIVSELKQGYPVIKTIDSYASCKHIKIFETVKRHNYNQTASHLISSVEQLYDEPSGIRKINFTVDAIGRLLDGDEGTVTEENYNTKSGVILTIDSEIQHIAEEAAADMETGAIAILDVETNEILALCSKSVEGDYYNRALAPYSVGSVFKLVISACAIEEGIDIPFECKGQITVGDTTFSCQKNKAHGVQNIKEALANSCNCYFINLALELGPDKISELSAQLGFGGITEFAENWSVSNGNFPNISILQSKGQLALLGFGQGSLTATPLQFCTVVSAIANGGIYSPPSVISGESSSVGEIIRFEPESGERVISENTAELLREYMRFVVTNGTGTRAEYKNNSAGKTSTAQSGRYENEKEILNTWFAGFYPYDNPKYAIVVLTENGTSGAVDCCPIFRSIVEKLDK